MRKQNIWSWTEYSHSKKSSIIKDCFGAEKLKHLNEILTPKKAAIDKRVRKWRQFSGSTSRHTRQNLSPIRPGATVCYWNQIADTVTTFMTICEIVKSKKNILKSWGLKRFQSARGREDWCLRPCERNGNWEADK